MVVAAAAAGAAGAGGVGGGGARGLRALGWGAREAAAGVVEHFEAVDGGGGGGRGGVRGAVGGVVGGGFVFFDDARVVGRAAAVAVVGVCRVGVLLLGLAEGGVHLEELGGVFVDVGFATRAGARGDRFHVEAAGGVLGGVRGAGDAAGAGAAGLGGRAVGAEAGWWGVLWEVFFEGGEGGFLEFERFGAELGLLRLWMLLREVAEREVGWG